MLQGTPDLHPETNQSHFSRLEFSYFKISEDEGDEEPVEWAGVVHDVHGRRVEKGAEPQDPAHRCHL